MTSIRATTGRLALLAALLLTLPLAAAAQERWAAPEDRAEAVLPPPQGDTAVSAASLACAERQWTFELSPRQPVDLAGAVLVELEIDAATFAAEAEFSSDRIAIALPSDALEPLKRGVGLAFRFEGDADAVLGRPRFSLAGSRAAITAAEEVCSRPDMSAYRALTFTPFSSYMALARRLRADDIAQFRLSTASEPVLSVAMAEFGNGRRVLFTRLCGSSWYFGRTGCNVTGFAPSSGEDEWQIAYDSEGVALHVDHGSDEFGWPDLVTLPLRGQGDVATWRWRGSQYGLLVF